MAQADIDAQESQAALIRMNVAWLRQAMELLERLSDAQFAASPAQFPPHRVGGHLRHVLEFYECFLRGLEEGRIDYDARVRDQTVERNRRAAMDRIGEIIRHLESEPALLKRRDVRVRVEDAEGHLPADPWLHSSSGRELQVLSSHTIHHFALIAMTCKALGIEAPPDFGVAPSTLRHRATSAAARGGKAA